MAFSSSKAGRVYNVLLERNDRVVSTNEIRAACNLLKLDFKVVLVGLNRAKVLEPVIFKGVYYVKRREEKDLGVIKEGPLNVIARACSLKLKKNWYFGLATALKLSGLWEQQTLATATIITKKRVQRANTSFAGMAVEFKQLSGVSFNELVRQKGVLRYSRPARTMLDYAYFGARSKNSLDYAKTILKEISRKTVGEARLMDQASKLVDQYPGLYQVFLRNYFELD